jgi:uncharacterized protein (TIGR03435 family)
MVASWFGSTVQAQPHGPVLEFDVSSVKANHSGSERGSMQITKGSLTIANAPFAKIVAAAFGISEDRDAYLLAGPTWIAAEKYDVIAKFPAATSSDQMRLMLQALLRERFGMRFHREVREVPAYVLVVAKSGLKARAAAEGSAGGFRRGLGHLESHAATMAVLADKLSQQSDRPVVDKTAVSGSYEFAIDWTPDDLQTGGQAGTSLFTAIQEQLGLKLEPRKEPMEVVVIDYVEKLPSEN